MKIDYIGQSGFIIEESDIRIGLDIWLENPLNPTLIEQIPKLKYLFLTHDHFDHGRADMIEIAKRDGATLITQTDIATDIIAKGELPNEQVSGANIGGEFIKNDLKITITQAFHSSDTGVPTGVIVRFPSGKSIYHLGDTGFFSELKFYGDLYNIDLMFVPIGGFFTMDLYTASFAVEAVNPRIAIPMHYNTFEKITADPIDFRREVSKRDTDTFIEIIEPGQTITI